ncbi:kinesin family member [Reticulomyxa filosa]|uniref:Kinesin family member n=1 Tax=Reticulomyxa filosa TaxID=46433 RepID=X6M307_RETFI|nr:kinesin family member [Reticulomyxa filosa]|eukprot:ETO08021.1 kinesin family member [Reticulomyxa filosa]
MEEQTKAKLDSTMPVIDEEETDTDATEQTEESKPKYVDKEEAKEKEKGKEKESNKRLPLTKQLTISDTLSDDPSLDDYETENKQKGSFSKTARTGLTDSPVLTANASKSPETVPNIQVQPQQAKLMNNDNSNDNNSSSNSNSKNKKTTVATPAVPSPRQIEQHKSESSLIEHEDHTPKAISKTKQSNNSDPARPSNPQRTNSNEKVSKEKAVSKLETSPKENKFDIGKKEEELF